MKKDISPTRQFLINRLGYFREKAGLSARELSFALGYSHGYIVKFEHGELNIPSDVLLEAIEICGATPEEFFAADVEKFAKNKEIVENYNKLSDESKEMLINLMKIMK